MSRILHLFDVSPFVHAGKVNKYSRLEQTLNMGTHWLTQVTPTGGISLIFNTLYSVAGTGDCVFCCDRNPVIKKEMLAGYKSNRDYDRDVEIQKAVAEYILQKCNCTVLARAGYEADDIIYTLTRKLKNQYDHIYIYTGDSDLYFLVDEKVSIKPSSTKAKEVTLQNYEKVLEKHGARYNSLTVQKILKGDRSDCIPALLKPMQKELASFLYDPQLLPMLGDKDFVRSWVAQICPDALSQVDIVFPLEVDDLPLEFAKPDIEMIKNFGDAMRNKMFRGRGDENFDVKPYVVDMQNKGYYLEEN